MENANRINNFVQSYLKQSVPHKGFEMAFLKIVI